MSQGAFTVFGEGADLRQVEGGYIHHFHEGICQVTQPSHLAVLTQVGLGKALPLPLCQPQGGQVNHHMLPLMYAAPVPAIPAAAAGMLAICLKRHFLGYSNAIVYILLSDQLSIVCQCQEAVWCCGYSLTCVLLAMPTVWHWC